MTNSAPMPFVAAIPASNKKPREPFGYSQYRRRLTVTRGVIIKNYVLLKQRMPSFYDQVAEDVMNEKTEEL